MRKVDLSADVGELEGPQGRSLDASLIAAVSTAHVASGGHAGDATSMRAAAEACREFGTRLGAHPSYPDRAGFGRRRLGLSSSTVIESVLEQIAALESVAASLDLSVRSVKPHGQLYHDLSQDEALAAELFSALGELPGRPVLVLAAGSRAASQAASSGLRVLEEAFCDRRYEPSGELASRARPDALISSPTLAAAQAARLATEGLLLEGRARPVQMLCVHSDSPGVLGLLAAVRTALLAAGVSIAPLG